MKKSSKKKPKKMIINILLILSIIYVSVGLLLYFGQKSLLYHPNNQDFNTCEAFKDYQKINSNGTRFYFKQGSNDNVIVHYHGNAGSTCDRAFTRPMFEQFNTSIIYVEYAGYSNDIVSPSKELILKDAKNIHDFIQKNEFTNVIVFGQSLGSAAASYQTSLGNVDHLILVTPFSTLQEVAQSMYKIFPASILLTENYDNIKWLQENENNLLIMHGDNDRIIPHKFSKNLFNKVPTDNKKYVLIEGSGHNDIWSSTKFQNTLNDYLSEVITDKIKLDLKE